MAEARRSATAIAHPNIALAKYWGKRDDGHNLPAVPSLSVTLMGMTTKTTVVFDASLPRDTLTIGGAHADEKARLRVAALLDRVRQASGVEEFARVESVNDFPTAAGLASSASGFAALALAATRAAGLAWSDAEVSDLARRTSVSAARSVFGDFVALAAGEAAQHFLAAAPFAARASLPLSVIVAVTREGPKDVLSSEGMLHTQRTSPYYDAWVASAPESFGRIGDAIRAGDFDALGRAAEASALRMHAAAIAAEPALVYWNGATVEALERVRRLRREGAKAYATIDAGPHVKVLTRPEDAARVEAEMSRVPGVLRVFDASPGGGARVVEAAT